MKINLFCLMLICLIPKHSTAQAYRINDPVISETTSDAEAVEYTNEEDFLSDAIPMPEGTEHAEIPDDWSKPGMDDAGVGGSFNAQFNSAWRRCGHGCRPVNPWIPGDKRHCAKKNGSCHNSRQAADIHTVSCGGRQFKAGSRDFNKIASCFKSSFSRVLWQQADHHKHFHVEFPGCYKKRRCG